MIEKKFEVEVSTTGKRFELSCEGNIGGLREVLASDDFGCGGFVITHKNKVLVEDSTPLTDYASECLVIIPNPMGGVNALDTGNTELNCVLAECKRDKNRFVIPKGDEDWLASFLEAIKKPFTSVWLKGYLNCEGDLNCKGWFYAGWKGWKVAGKIKFGYGVVQEEALALFARARVISETKKTEAQTAKEIEAKLKMVN